MSKSIEELEKDYAQMKFAIGVLAGVLVFYFIITIPKALEGNSVEPVIVPLVLSTMLPIFFMKIRKMKKEIDLRKEG